MQKAVTKTVAAFLNGEGGTLLIGVNDDGLVVGIEKDMASLDKRPDLDGYRQMLQQLVINAVGAVAAASTAVSFPVVDGRQICMVRVPASAEPVYCDSGKAFYVRSDNTTRELTVEEATSYIRHHFGAG